MTTASPSGAPDAPPPRMLTAKEVARRLQIRTRTLWRWVSAGRFPPPRRFNARVLRWPPEDVERYLQDPEAPRAQA